MVWAILNFKQLAKTGTNLALVLVGPNIVQYQLQINFAKFESDSKIAATKKSMRDSPGIAPDLPPLLISQVKNFPIVCKVFPVFKTTLFPG